MVQSGTRDEQHRILREIGGMADHVRQLRQRDAVRNSAEIRALTGELRSKWDELRVLRAPPVGDDLSTRRRGGLYR